MSISSSVGRWRSGLRSNTGVEGASRSLPVLQVTSEGQERSLKMSGATSMIGIYKTLQSRSGQLAGWVVNKPVDSWIAHHGPCDGLQTSQ